MKRKIALDDHDEALMLEAKVAILKACSLAHSPYGVARCLHSVASGQRRKGYSAAVRRHPFPGFAKRAVCRWKKSTPNLTS
jgi:hypothetical protein